MNTEGRPFSWPGLSLPEFRETSHMIRISNPARGVVRCLGLVAAAMLALSSVPQRAEALSLINPGAASTAKLASGGLTTEVRDGHGGHGGGGGGGGGGFHGGGGGGFHGGGPVFHGGGFHSGGAVFHGGGFRAGPVFHGGGHRYSGLRYGGYRFAHHHVHRRFFYGASYYRYDDYPYYYSYRRCRVIWTYYGPRRVCHYRHWRHHHHRQHRIHW
jgi:hypothetical protein